MNFWHVLRKSFKKIKWDAITGKSISENNQDLVDSTEFHKSIAWFELNELVKFGKDDVAKRETMNSESNSHSEKVLLNFV